MANLNLDPLKHRIALLLSHFIEHEYFRKAVERVKSGIPGTDDSSANVQ